MATDSEAAIYLRWKFVRSCPTMPLDLGGRTIVLKFDGNRTWLDFPAKDGIASSNSKKGSDVGAFQKWRSPTLCFVTPLNG